MNVTTARFGAALVAALLSVACTEDGSDGSASRETGNMPNMPEQAHNGAAHNAMGTVNSVDAATGTVNISHGPIESIGWPAMTMNFRLADPALAASLKPGQHVRFAFKTDQGSATVTEIVPTDATN